MSLEAEMKIVAKAMNDHIDRTIYDGLFTGTTTNNAAPPAGDLNVDALLKMIDDMPPVLRAVILWDRDECYLVTTRCKDQYLLAPLSWKNQIETLFLPTYTEHPANFIPFGGIRIEYDNDRAEKLFAEANTKLCEKLMEDFRKIDALFGTINPFKF